MKSVKNKPSKAKTKKAKKTTTYPRTAHDAFVTNKMLFSVRDELISFSEHKFHEVKTEFHGVKSEIHELRSEIHGVKSEIHELRSEIHEVKSQVSQLEKTMHKVALLVEDQNNRNKIVLDGLSQLFERQDRVEKKLDNQI